MVFIAMYYCILLLLTTRIWFGEIAKVNTSMSTKASGGGIWMNWIL